MHFYLAFLGKRIPLLLNSRYMSDTPNKNCCQMKNISHIIKYVVGMSLASKMQYNKKKDNEKGNLFLTPLAPES